MRGEWCYFKSYIDKATCEKILSDGLTIPAQDAGINEDGRIDKSFRKSRIRFINADDTRFSYVFDTLWRTALQANKDFFDVHISKLDYIQLAEYESTYAGEYKEHHDVLWMNRDPLYHRKLSCIIQLSDPSSYEGGKFELTEASHQIDEEIKEQGTIIYFPSVMRHKANPVTKGVRYSIAAWFDGPKWR